MTGPTDRTHLSEWPVEQTVFLTLDLERDYGTAFDRHTYEAAEQTPELVDLLVEFDIPLTCFLQTELLSEIPDAVRSLENADVPVEFHPHSHTHPKLDEADMAFEIERSVEAVRERYGTEPLGYRFPDGAASPENYQLLDDRDVAFSASVFPSWRPGRFNHMTGPRYPFRHPDTNVVELPFTVYSKWFRVPVALSYLKLLGRTYQGLVNAHPPDVIVFDMHMHDLMSPSAIADLPRPYQLVYARQRDRGMTVLRNLVESLHEDGYRFGLMSELYERTREAIDQQRDRTTEQIEEVP